MSRENPPWPGARGRTTEPIALHAEAAERFAGVGESATTSLEIWRLVDW